MYPTLGTGFNVTTPTDLLVYANVLTGGIFGPLLLFGFWLVALLGGLFMQLRFSGRERFETVFAAASFATFGLSALLSLQNGLLNPLYVFIALGLVVISVLWLCFSSPSP